MIHASVDSLDGTYENTVGEVGHLRFSDDTISVPVFTVKDYAKMLSVSPETIRRYIDEGKLIGIKIDRVWYVQSWSFASMVQKLDDIPF